MTTPEARQLVLDARKDLSISEAHLRHIVSEFVPHYHGNAPTRRHQAKTTYRWSPPEWPELVRDEDLVCRKRLGGS